MQWSTGFAKPIFRRVFGGEAKAVSALCNFFEIVSAISEHLSGEVGHVAVNAVIYDGIMNDQLGVCSEFFHDAILKSKKRQMFWDKNEPLESRVRSIRSAVRGIATRPISRKRQKMKKKTMSKVTHIFKCCQNGSVKSQVKRL